MSDDRPSYLQAPLPTRDHKEGEKDEEDYEDLEEDNEEEEEEEEEDEEEEEGEGQEDEEEKDFNGKVFYQSLKYLPCKIGLREGEVDPRYAFPTELDALNANKIQ